MILSQKQRMKIAWIFSETSLGSWLIKAKLHEGGYCGEGNRTNLILVLYCKSLLSCISIKVGIDGWGPAC